MRTIAVTCLLVLSCSSGSGSSGSGSSGSGSSGSGSPGSGSPGSGSSGSGSSGPGSSGTAGALWSTGNVDGGSGQPDCATAADKQGCFCSTLDQQRDCQVGTCPG